MTKVSDLNGTPVLVFINGKQSPPKMGFTRIKLVLDNLDACRAFVEEQEKIRGKAKSKATPSLSDGEHKEMKEARANARKQIAKVKADRANGNGKCRFSP